MGAYTTATGTNHLDSLNHTHAQHATQSSVQNGFLSRLEKEQKQKKETLKKAQSKYTPKFRPTKRIEVDKETGRRRRVKIQPKSWVHTVLQPPSPCKAPSNHSLTLCVVLWLWWCRTR